MSDRSELLAQILFDFRAQYLEDEERGAVAGLEVYQRRFPGFEPEIGAEYAGLADRADDPQPDERRVAHFRLLRLLGRGGQGAVYLAEDLKLGRKVALKLLGGLSFLAPDARRRFQREAEMASRLDHPGICTVYENGADGELVYLAMRYVEGETLARRIAVAQEARAPAAEFGKRFPAAPSSREELEACLAFFEEAARALHAAHALGVIHRDVKPGNLMISTEDRPVFLDFGLARESETGADPITLTGDVLGTPGYMSPEQLDTRGDPLDRRTDVYSLAAALYECLTLELPFRAPTLDKLYQAILSDPLPDPRRSNPSLPKDLAVVLQTALERDRARRYLSALEFAEELGRIRRHEPIRARAPGAWLRTLRWVQRHPARAVAAALIVLLGGASTFALAMRARARDLQQARDDLAFGERLLDHLADSPRRGPYFDWASCVRAEWATFARNGLPLDGSVPESELAQRIARVTLRAPGLGSAIRAGLYELAATLDDAEIGPRSSDVWVPADLGPAALAAPEWSRPRQFLLSLVGSLEQDPWRREAWSAFREFVATRRDGFDAILRSPALEGRSAADLVFLAELVYYVRRDGAAIALYDMAEALPPASPDTRYAIRLSRGLLRLRAAQPDLAGALADLDVAWELRPHSAPTCVGLASAHLARGESEQALRYARRAVAADPASASAHKLLAQVLVRSGLWPEGEAVAREAQVLDPRDPSVGEWIAECRLSQGDIPGALACWSEAAQVARPPERVWLDAGTMLSLRGLPAVPVAAALDRGTGSERARCALLAGHAAASTRAGGFTSAVESLRAACAIDPSDAGLRVSLGQALEALCDEPSAVEAFREAARLDPAGLEPRRDLAAALFASGDAAGALGVLAGLAAEHPDDVEAAFAEARARLELGDVAPSVECARRALDYAPDHRAALALLIEASLRGGLRQAAFDGLLRELDLEPERELDAERILGVFQSGALEPSAAASRIAELHARHATSVTIAVVDALVQARLGAGEQAEDMLRRAAELDPARALALAYVANFDAGRGDLDRAERESREALAREPGSDLARALRIEILCLRGEYAAAVAESRIAIQSGTRRSLVWSRALEAARMSGACAALLESGTRLLADDPGRVDARDFVLRCLHSLGRFDVACEMLAGEQRRHPSDSRIQEELGSFLFDAGRWAEAVEVLQSLPENPRRTQRTLEIARKRQSAASLQLGGASASELYDAGRFAEASEALEGADLDGPGAWHFAACCAARGAEGACDDRSRADRLANRALECLERDLDRQQAELAAQSSEEGRAPILRSLAGQLDERDLVFVREPPPAVGWSGRAAAYFWRLREILGSAPRPRR